MPRIKQPTRRTLLMQTVFFAINWFITIYFELYSKSSCLSPRLLSFSCYFYFPFLTFHYYWICCTSLCLPRQTFHNSYLDKLLPGYFVPLPFSFYLVKLRNALFSLNSRVDNLITLLNVLHRPKTDFGWHHKQIRNVAIIQVYLSRVRIGWSFGFS